MAKILIVDDEKSIRVTLGEFLRREGYEVLVQRRTRRLPRSC